MCVEELRVNERADGAVDIVAGDALQQAERAGAVDLEFAERAHVEQRDALAAGEAFLADKIVIWRAAPAPLMLVGGRLATGLAGPEKVDAFPAVFLAELRAENGKSVVQRTLAAIAGPQSFVGRVVLMVVIVVHLARLFGDKVRVAKMRAKAANIHLVQVERWLAVDDPLGQHLAHATGPGDAVERHAGGDKKSGYTRHRAEAVMAVWCHGIGAVDQLNDLGLFELGYAAHCTLHHWLEQFPVLGQKLLGEVPRDAVGGPCLGLQFETADQESAHLLAEIKQIVGITHDWRLLRQLVARDVTCGKVLMHERHHRGDRANHCREKRCPLPGGIDDNPGLHRALVCLDVGDRARVVAVDARHATVGLDGDAELAGALGKLERNAVGIQPAVVGNVHRALDVPRRKKRRDIERLTGSDGADIEPQPARPADLPLECLEPVWAGGEA